MTSFKNCFPAGPPVLVSANSRYAYSFVLLQRRDIAVEIGKKSLPLDVRDCARQGRLSPSSPKLFVCLSRTKSNATLISVDAIRPREGGWESLCSWFIARTKSTDFPRIEISPPRSVPYRDGPRCARRFG
jgi:hypothetical protein